MQYTLNIGLEPSKKTSRKTRITKHEIMAALRGAGFYVRFYREEPENRPLYEATAVVVVAPRMLTYVEPAIHNVSVALSQDCIAALNDDIPYGMLIGPNADEWGEFDPAYFIPFEGGIKYAA